MRQSNLPLEKYRVTQGGYIRLATAVELGMGITNSNLLYCHGVVEVNEDRKFSTLEYNNRAVYDCFDNTFTDKFCALMIDPTSIKDPNIPQICSQMTNMLSLKCF